MNQYSQNFGRINNAIRGVSHSTIKSPTAKKLVDSFVPHGQSSPPSPQVLTDRQMTLAAMEQLTERAVKSLQPLDGPEDFPHPLITDENLRHYLVHATATQSELRSKASVRSQAVLQPMAPLQANLGESLIHCLHQLDHRTRRQDERIQELEAALAQANRRVSLLEAGQGQTAR